MSGKYRELLKGDIAPKSALAALQRKVAKQDRRLNESEEREKARAAAADEAAEARAADPWSVFVTRDELRHAVETGELPESWLEAPAFLNGDGEGE